MELSRLRLPIKVKPNDEERLRNELKKNYLSVIEAVKEDFWGRFNLKKAQNDKEIRGEIYFADGEILFYYYIPQERNFIETGCLIKDEKSSNIFENFCDSVKNILFPGIKTSEFHWQHFIPINQNFKLLKGEAHHLVPTDQDLLAADVLQDEDVRSLLSLLEKSKQCFLENIISEADKEQALNYIEVLLSNGLINREFIVFCRNNNVQISRVPDISAIQDASSRGLKCPFCERIFSEERIDQSISLTPFGTKMIKPNFWLALHILKLLSNIGISYKNILVKEEKDSRVFDLLVNLEHFFILIEVKDTPPRLDEIFLFYSRINFSKPDLSIFITPNPLSNEARLYLKKYHELPIIIIDSFKDIENILRDVFRQKRGAYIYDVFATFAQYTQLNIAESVANYFLEDTLSTLQKIVNKTTGRIAEQEDTHTVLEVSTTPKAETLEEETMEEDTYMPQEVIPESFTSIVEDEMEKYSENDLIDEIDVKKMAKSIREKEEESKFVKETPEEKETSPKLIEETEKPTKFGLADELRALREDLSAHAAPELAPSREIEKRWEAEEKNMIHLENDFKSGEPLTSVTNEEQELESEVDTDEAILLEEHIGVNLGQEIIPTFEISQEEKSIDESREQIVRRIIDEIIINGILGQIPMLEEMLKELRGINSYTGLIVSKEGLVIADDGNQNFDFELFGALGVEIFKNIENSFRDIISSEIISIYISLTSEHIYMYPIPDAILILHEALVSEQEDESSSLPGETELRDIIMKKVLEDLGRINGIIGNIVSSTDGLSIDYTFNEEIDIDIDIDLISSICSQIIGDNAKFIQRIGECDLKQIVIFSEKSIYSLIPLNGEAILISVLEPNISKEVWKMKLANSALMIASALQ